jgi:hypothetical protein
MPAVWPSATLDVAPSRIVAVQGAPNADIQELFAGLTVIWRRIGLRLAGLLEEAVPSPADGRVTRRLRDIATGAAYTITQELGPGSTACSLDTGGFAAACSGVEAALQRGCDLVIISKFGKLEAERGGLMSAFQAAIGAGVPVLTSVPSYAEKAWAGFAEPLTVFMRPDREAIENWRCSVARAASGRRAGMRDG